MKINKIIFCLFAAIHSYSFAELHILLTAALTDSYAEFRQRQYIEMFENLFKYGYSNVYVIEAIKKSGPTFLDDYSTNVFYATVNDLSIPNTGVNEARTTLEGLNYFESTGQWHPDDMILKITGRYKLLSDDFLRFVATHIDDYDAFVKIRPNTPQHNFLEHGGLYTVCFAMKEKYLKEMYLRMPYEKMIREYRHLEWELDNYIKYKVKRGKFKVCYVETFNLEARLLGSTSMPGIGDVTVIL